MEKPSYKNTISSYELLAAVYDRRWQGYHKRTLGVALRALRLSGSERILDVGCGTGEFERIALAKHPDLRIVGVDLTPAMLEVAKKKLASAPQVSFQLASAEALPLASATFDAVVSANVLHYVHQPGQMFAECVRTLRPGGVLVIVGWCRDGFFGAALQTWLWLTNRRGVYVSSLDEIVRMLGNVRVTLRSKARFIAPPCYSMMCISATKDGVASNG